MTQPRDVEVDEKAYALATQFEVREQLRFVDRQDCLDRFHLDDHFAFDEQVDTVAEFNKNAVVFDWERFFGFERNVKALQFVTKAYLIGPFEKPGTELGMHSVCSAQNAIRDGAVNTLNTVSSVCIGVLRGSAFRWQTAGQV